MVALLREILCQIMCLYLAALGKEKIIQELKKKH